MNRIKRVLYAIESAVLLLGAVFVIAVGFLIYQFSGPDLLKRYDQPLSYQEASGKPEIDFPLPVTSSEIYFAVYADWQVWTRLVRFKAPAGDCIRHVDTLTAWLSTKDPKASFSPLVEVTNVKTPGAGLLEPAPWFAPQSIARGLHTEARSSTNPQVWIDLEKGIFYYRETN